MTEYVTDLCPECGGTGELPEVDEYVTPCDRCRGTGFVEEDVEIREESSVTEVKAPPCYIKGPYLPLGDTDWHCTTHDVMAMLRNPSRFGAHNIRREEMACPIGEGVLTEDGVIVPPLVQRNDSGRGAHAAATAARREVRNQVRDLGYERVSATSPNYDAPGLLSCYTESFTGPLGRLDIHWGS